ncbi:hypothetical protein AQUCO_08500017v1 [Aquilegia coerulea]|uniref:Uncharacterized protein n=1 Tax=Aquilegia coerulea TaxID=218851 RepID=A0A2G5C6M2_AQUCA|nr:hypothetical protein AQUCO_08500017v1 [Aquilegia coerulea]
MEKGPSPALTSSLQKLHLNKDESKTNNVQSNRILIGKTIFQRPFSFNEKIKCPSLVSLCLGVLGKHFEDIIEHLSVIAATLPPYTKLWFMCSRCYRITALGVSELLSHCQSLETLRCGGCHRSDTAVRRCLGFLKPKLNDVAGDSWEELDSKDIANGAESLRWLLWPKIDDNSRDILASDCPRIVVNPKPSVFSVRGFKVPNEAIADLALDESFVQGIDPNTWVIPGVVRKVVTLSDSSPSELPIAEKFRLAFVQRDERLAPKRAKNVRQRQRRAEKEWMMTNAEAKSVVLAARHSKSLHGRT